MVGALHYLSMTGTDIAFAVTIWSQFFNCRPVHRKVDRSRS